MGISMDQSTARGRAAESLLFADLPSAAVARALDCLEFREYATGDAIIAEATTASSPAESGLYLLVDGELSASRAIPDGRRETLSTMYPGEFFGELAAMGESTRSATVIAVHNSAVARLPDDATRRLIADAPEVLRTIATTIATRLRRADEARINALINEAKLAVLGRTAAMLVHDLRNPIGVVKNAAQLIEEGVGDPATWARRSRGAAEFMLGMVQDLMDFAKGDRVCAQDSFELHDLLADVEAFGLQPIEEAHTVRVTRELCENTQMCGDRRALCRALLNIVKNGAEAMPQGGELQFRTASAGSSVMFQITDTGPGISEAALGKLFEPFSTFGKRGGTGLGMALTKSAVDAHRGSIEVRTSAGHGTTFIVSIPLPVPPPTSPG
jgi:signal transduction histidine kinase